MEGQEPKNATHADSTAGIAFWLNSHYRLTGGHKVGKDDPRVQTLYTDIMKVFEEGRTTSLSDDEMEKFVERHFPNMGKE